VVSKRLVCHTPAADSDWPELPRLKLASVQRFPPRPLRHPANQNIEKSVAFVYAPVSKMAEGQVNDQIGSHISRR
jgi:hypothetical protein